MADRPISQRLVPGLLSFRDSPTVELVVGKDKVSFTVHERPLCNAAGFFTKALQSGFKESQERRIELPEDDPLVVDCFTKWLYFNSYDLPSTPRAGFALLIKLYIFADRCFADRLQEDIIRVLFHCYREGWTPPPSAIQLVFEQAPETSPIRRLMVDWYAFHVDLKSLQTPKASTLFETVPQLARELIPRMAERIMYPSIKPLHGNPETYFEQSSKGGQDSNGCVSRD